MSTIATTALTSTNVAITPSTSFRKTTRPASSTSGMQVVTTRPRDKQITVVTFTDESVVINIGPSDTIEDVKEKVYEKTGIPPDQQQLEVHGKILNDGASLYALGVADGAILEMTSGSFTTSAAPTAVRNSTQNHHAQASLAPAASKYTNEIAHQRPSLYIALAVILPMLFVGLYGLRERQKRFKRMKVAPAPEASLTLWDGKKPPVLKKAFTLQSPFGQASLCTTPDYRNDDPLPVDIGPSPGCSSPTPDYSSDDCQHIKVMDSRKIVGTRTKEPLPHLLGRSTGPRRVVKTNPAASSSLPSRHPPPQPPPQISPPQPITQPPQLVAPPYYKQSRKYPMVVSPPQPITQAPQLPQSAQPPQLDHMEKATSRIASSQVQSSELRNAARQPGTPSVPEVADLRTGWGRLEVDWVRVGQVGGQLRIDPRSIGNARFPATRAANAVPEQLQTINLVKKKVRRFREE